MANKTMTYAQALDVILNGEEVTATVIERLTALRATFDKKSVKADSKAGMALAENEKAMQDILDGMTPNRKYTVTEIFTEIVPHLSSANKVNALVTKLKNDERIVRVEEKRKAYFMLPATEDEEE